MTELVDRVRERLVTDASVDLALRAESDGVVDDAVFDRLRREVSAELAGAGPLEPLLALEGVTDVVVNGPAAVFIDRGDGMERVPVRFESDAAVRRLACRLANSVGRRLDDATPFADAVLADGTRLHAVLPPLVTQTSIALRVLRRQQFDLTALVGSPVAGDLLRGVVDARLSFLVTGATGAGKTTLLAAMLGEVGDRQRLVTVEDVPELAIDHANVVSLLTRSANVEGIGGIGPRELVRQALRMRPDRLIVGEFRGAEIVDALVALTTGHRGSGATMHADSAADVPARVIALGALAGLPPGAVTSLVSAGIDVVVHVARAGGCRFVEEIALLSQHDGRVAVSPAWTIGSGRGDGYERLHLLMRAGTQ